MATCTALSPGSSGSGGAACLLGDVGRLPDDDLVPVDGRGRALGRGLAGGDRRHRLEAALPGAGHDRRRERVGGEELDGRRRGQEVVVAEPVGRLDRRGSGAPRVRVPVLSKAAVRTRESSSSASASTMIPASRPGTSRP